MIAVPGQSYYTLTETPYLGGSRADTRRIQKRIADLPRQWQAVTGKRIDDVPKPAPYHVTPPDAGKTYAGQPAVFERADGVDVVVMPLAEVRP